MKTINQLIESYHHYIKADFTFAEVTKNTYEITTPFLDRRNDNISFFITLDNGKVRITDDGYTLGDLEMSGIDIHTKKRKEEIQRILIGHGIQLQNNEIVALADEAAFPNKQHNMIQALLSINDLYLTSRSNILSLFTEEVGDYFEEVGIAYIAGASFSGKSGFTHNFDFAIPAQLRNNKKEAIIKAINHPKKSNIETTIFSFADLERNDDSFVLLNDTETRISEEITEALQNYNITPLVWSNKQKIKNSILAA